MCIFVVVCLFTIFLFLSKKKVFFEKNTYWENRPQTHPCSGWVCLSLGGEC